MKIYKCDIGGCGHGGSYRKDMLDQHIRNCHVKGETRKSELVTKSWETLSDTGLHLIRIGGGSVYKSQGSCKVIGSPALQHA